ncbi:hypothetical protein [Plantactinospora sp. B24E8]|uniref:hypothetical protein n=1 Tax=Plantactinospora sp. B24E8 TaxID=3153567 RepID=UPI00325D3A47
MRTTRVLLFVLGVAAVAYGGWSLRPEFGSALPWLVAGPLLHDVLVAPLVGLVGLALARLVPHRRRRRWITAGLVASATLLLVAVPLLWRPAAAPPNPGLQDRDYLAGLTVWLTLLWVVVAVALLAGPRLRRAVPGRVRHAVPGRLRRAVRDRTRRG